MDRDHLSHSPRPPAPHSHAWGPHCAGSSRGWRAHGSPGARRSARSCAPTPGLPHSAGPMAWRSWPCSWCASASCGCSSAPPTAQPTPPHAQPLPSEAQLIPPHTYPIPPTAHPPALPLPHTSPAGPSPCRHAPRASSPPPAASQCVRPATGAASGSCSRSAGCGSPRLCSWRTAPTSSHRRANSPGRGISGPALSSRTSASSRSCRWTSTPPRITCGPPTPRT